jgi:hypothetical protein
MLQGHAAAHRGTVGLTGHPQVSAHGDADQIAADEVCVGTGETEGGDRAVDQPRVGCGQVGRVEAQGGQNAGAEGLEHHVDSGQERPVTRPPSLAHEVEDDPALAGLERQPGQAALGIGVASQIGRAAQLAAAAGGLDGDHVGAQIAQDPARQRPGLVAEIEDAHSLQHRSGPPGLEALGRGLRPCDSI